MHGKCKILKKLKISDKICLAQSYPEQTFSCVLIPLLLREIE